MITRWLTSLAIILAPAVFAAQTHEVTVSTDATLIHEAIPVIPLVVSPGDSTFESEFTAASVRFYQADGTTVLPHYAVGTPTGTAGLYLINVADYISTSVDVDIVIKFGDGALSDASDSEAVFSGTNYYGFWTLTGADAFVNLVDPGNHDLTVGGGSPLAGQTGPFEGTESYLFAAGDTDWLKATVSISGGWPSMVGGFATRTGGDVSFSVGRNNSNRDQIIVTWTSDTAITVSAVGADATTNNATQTSLPAGFKYVAGMRDATIGTTTNFVGGVGTATDTTTISDPNGGAFNQYTVGARARGTAAYFSGSVSMVELRAAVPTPDAMATWYAAWDDPDFLTWGATTSLEPSGGVTDWIEFTVSATTTPGDQTWSNPDYALTSLATATTNDLQSADISYRLLLDAADFTGVAGTINGVQVEVAATGEDASSRELYDYEVSLIVGGTVSGDNKASATKWGDDSIETRYYGSLTDNWGLSLADTDFDSDFGVSLRYWNDGGQQALMSVYRVRVRVSYGTVVTPENQGAFFALF